MTTEHSLREALQKLDKMLCDAFARRVHVEQALLKMAAGKLPLPDAAKCREFAIALGVPSSPIVLRVLDACSTPSDTKKHLAEAREIIWQMVNDLALRAKLRSSYSGLKEDAALDISDGILLRAQLFLNKVKP